jgi:hypothetical protein
LRNLEPWLTLLPRFEAVRRGDAELADAAEFLKLAELAQMKGVNRTASGLFAWALRGDAKLASELSQPYRGRGNAQARQLSHWRGSGRTCIVSWGKLTPIAKRIFAPGISRRASVIDAQMQPPAGRERLVCKGAEVLRAERCPTAKCDG